MNEFSFGVLLFPGVVASRVKQCLTSTEYHAETSRCGSRTVSFGQFKKHLNTEYVMKILLIVVDPKHVCKTFIMAGQVRTFFFFDREAHISDFGHKILNTNAREFGYLHICRDNVRGACQFTRVHPTTTIIVFNLSPRNYS